MKAKKKGEHDMKTNEDGNGDEMVGGKRRQRWQKQPVLDCERQRNGGMTRGSEEELSHH